jgi:hypothetical protein
MILIVRLVETDVSSSYIAINRKVNMTLLQAEKVENVVYVSASFSEIHGCQQDFRG